MFKKHLHVFDQLKGIVAQLNNIYGELNRIRLIMSEKSKIGQRIIESDEKHNGYVPFTDKAKNYNKFVEKNKI